MTTLRSLSNRIEAIVRRIRNVHECRQHGASDPVMAITRYAVTIELSLETYPSEYLPVYAREAK